MKTKNEEPEADANEANIHLLRGVGRLLHFPFRRPAAFTLIEVMVVIGIIAILAALMYPVILGVRTSARQKQATAEARAIVLALNAYRQEYGKWPAQIQAAADTTYVVSNYCVIQPLLGSNWGGFNPKNKIFLNLQSNILDYAGNYLDPWGIPYVICVDENEDNQLTIRTNVLWSYVASNTASRQIGKTNICFTNQQGGSTDAGAASLGGSSNTLNWKSW